MLFLQIMCYIVVILSSGMMLSMLMSNEEVTIVDLGGWLTSVILSAIIYALINF